MRDERIVRQRIFQTRIKGLTSMSSFCLHPFSLDALKAHIGHKEIADAKQI